MHPPTFPHRYTEASPWLCRRTGSNIFGCLSRYHNWSSIKYSPWCCRCCRYSSSKVTIVQSIIPRYFESKKFVHYESCILARFYTDRFRGNKDWLQYALFDQLHRKRDLMWSISFMHLRAFRNQHRTISILRSWFIRGHSVYKRCYWLSLYFPRKIRLCIISSFALTLFIEFWTAFFNPCLFQDFKFPDPRCILSLREQRAEICRYPRLFVLLLVLLIAACKSLMRGSAK